MKDVKKSITNRCNMIKAIGGRYKGANRTTMLNIFNAIVLSKMLYGAHLYSSSTEDMWDIIAPQFNQTIRTITGALRTSPVESILAEAGVLPLNTQIKLNTIVKAIKWMELHDHNNNLGKFLVERANRFAAELTGENLPEIAKRETPLGRKWYEPKVKIDWTIKKRVKAGGQQTIAKQEFLNTLNKYPNHNVIYTDGSLKEDEVGCGISHNNTETTIKLNKMCTIYSAESKALHIATKHIALEDKPNLIFTDSASCLDALHKGTSHHPWIEKIQRAAEEKDITICWVPGHAGIKGNELADKAAQKGRENGTNYEAVPAQDAINWYKTRTVWSHEYRWRRKSDTFLRRSKPTTLPWKDRKNVKDQRTLTRLRIGHTWLSHGYLLHKEDQPRCQYCNDILTADHIIRNCAGYDETRTKYNITGLEIYNNTETNERNLLEFLKETELLNKI